MADLKSTFGGKVGQGVSVTMHPSGAQLLRGMETWAKLVKGGFSEAWPHATALIHRHNRRTFDSEGSATGDGKRWAPLKGAGPPLTGYALQKARDYPGRPLLVRTSALRSALTEGGRGSRVRKRKNSLEVGARGDVARIGAYHQFGTSNMVARPPIKFDHRLRANSKPYTLPFVVSQMFQRIIVDHRKAALKGEDVFEPSRTEKRLKSLSRLARERTR